MLQLEYKNSLDKSGTKAGLAQARLDKKSLALQVESNKQDLHYRISSVQEDITRGRSTLKAARDRLVIEKRKLRDGRDRYRQGRINTQQLLLLESDLSQAELKVTQQEIELAQNLAQLRLMERKLWPEDSDRDNK